MSNWQKAAAGIEPYWTSKYHRTMCYYRFIYGYAQIPCIACNGSGYWDNDGSPSCDSCDGTGKEKRRGPKWEELPEYLKTSDNS